LRCRRRGRGRALEALGIAHALPSQHGPPPEAAAPGDEAPTAAFRNGD
jgi:hypothetical protein